MKNLLIIILFTTIYKITGAQVKVGDNPGTISSKAILELEHTSKGLLLPRLVDTNAVVGGGTSGLLIYSKVDSFLYYHDGVKWWPLSRGVSSPAATVVANCSISGFNGNYYAGVPLTGNSFTVTITNNTFSSVTIPLASTDLMLSGPGLGSLVVGTPAPASPVTIPVGATQVLTYPLTGTPSSTAGNITGVWTKLALSCTKTVLTTYQPPVINCLETTTSITASSYLTNGNVYSGVATVTYISTNTSAYAAFSQTVNGLTLSNPGGNYIVGTGTIIYSLSGTYSGATGGTAVFTLPSGCTVVYGCGSPIHYVHTAGLNGAPTTKTIDYATAYTNLSGANQCWIAQNLGAVSQASALGDISTNSRGWFWQYDRSQGYESNGSVSPAWNTNPNNTPANTWSTLNDPCKKLLGADWRLPSYSDWFNADIGWSTPTDAFNSVLRLHKAGFISIAGVPGGEGAQGQYWTNQQNVSSFAYIYYMNGGGSYINSTNMITGSTVRCLKD